MKAEFVNGPLDGLVCVIKRAQLPQLLFYAAWPPGAEVPVFQCTSFEEFKPCYSLQGTEGRYEFTGYRRSVEA